MCAAEVHNSFSYIVANMSLVIIEEREVSVLLFFVLLFVAYHIYNMNLHEVFFSSIDIHNTEQHFKRKFKRSVVSTTVLKTVIMNIGANAGAHINVR